MRRNQEEVVTDLILNAEEIKFHSGQHSNQALPKHKSDPVAVIST
jgi:hypothetical protein